MTERLAASELVDRQSALIGKFCQQIYILCQFFGGSVSSWIRSSKHNKAVGGVPLSLHKVGLAVDVILDEPTDAVKARFIEACEKAGLKALDEGNHIHVSVGEYL